MPSDGELLGRFLTQKDQSSFAEVVRRHAGLVSGVCKRVLGNGADAEDVCQAVFLLLAQRADSLCKAEHLGAWLYTVAVNVARNAQSKAARRRMHERQVGVMQRQGDSGEDDWEQVRSILDVEMSRLSEKYRLPLVMCYFEGKTTETAAKELGWATGTLKTRLAHGRDLLRGRLVRQGVAISGGALFALIAERAASAAVSPAFVASTAQAATLVAAGKAVGTNLVSAQVSALVKGGLKAMMWTKIKIAAAVMAASVAGTGGSVAAYKALAPEQETKAEAVKVPVVPKGLPPAIPVEKFKKLHETIKPYPGEFAWLDDIPWLISIQEAREKAAAEGKPIAIWAAATGHHLGHT